MSELTDLTTYEKRVQAGERLTHEDALELYRGVQRERVVKQWAERQLHKERQAATSGERETFYRKVQARLEARNELVMRAIDVVLAHWTLHTEKNSRNWRSVANQMADYVRVILDGDAHLLVISDKAEDDFLTLDFSLAPDVTPDYSGDRG